MKEEKESRLLRALAAALARDLKMSYQRLAVEVGVGRRTLYRIAPNRDALFERLRQEAVAANAAALLAAGLFDKPFLDALYTLTDEFVSNAPLYEFWAADTWGKGRTLLTASASDTELHSYHEEMSRFFERGKVQGHIRPDLPTAWLLAAYDGLLIAATTCRRSGTPKPESLASLMIQTFLSGISVAHSPEYAAHERSVGEALPR